MLLPRLGRSAEASIAGAIIVLMAFVTLSASALAVDERVKSNVDYFEVSPERQTLLGLFVTTREVEGLLRGYPDIVLIDVRGLIDVAATGTAFDTPHHVPFLLENHAAVGATFDGRPRKVINPHFVDHVLRIVSDGKEEKSRTILVICRRGWVSARAANFLAEHGFTNIYSVIDGLEGKR